MEEEYPPTAKLANLEKEVLTKEFRDQFADPEGWKIHYEERKKSLDEEIADTDDRRERNLRELAEAREKIREIEKKDPGVTRKRQERIDKYRW